MPNKTYTALKDSLAKPLKMIRLQKINFPADCEIISFDFYDYDPVHAFIEADSLNYLSEDLLHCSFPEENITIDLGWYGDLSRNKGEFKIHIIENENWEVPLNVIHSKSVEEIKTLLNKILQYYTAVENNTEYNEA